MSSINESRSSQGDLPILEAILTRTNQIYSAITALTGLGAKIMSAISDLQTAEANVAAADASIASAVASVQTAVNAAIGLIQGFQNGTTNADDPQVETVVGQLNSANTDFGSAASALSAAASALNAAVAPVVTAPPAPMPTTPIAAPPPAPPAQTSNPSLAPIKTKP